MVQGVEAGAPPSVMTSLKQGFLIVSVKVLVLAAVKLILVGWSSTVFHQATYLRVTTVSPVVANFVRSVQ
jgi:hypothetical protein